MSEDLKPCPFCGGPAIRLDKMNIQCENSECLQPYVCELNGDPAYFWNTRAAQSVGVKPLEVEERRNHRLGLGPYEVAPNGPDKDGNIMWRIRFHGRVICKQIKGVERAVKWVQDHHRNAVLNELQPVPVTVQQAATIILNDTQSMNEGAAVLSQYLADNGTACAHGLTCALRALSQEGK